MDLYKEQLIKFRILQIQSGGRVRMPCIIEHPTPFPLHLPPPPDFSGRPVLIIKHNLFIPVKHVNVYVK